MKALAARCRGSAAAKGFYNLSALRRSYRPSKSIENMLTTTSTGMQRSHLHPAMSRDSGCGGFEDRRERDHYDSGDSLFRVLRFEPTSEIPRAVELLDGLGEAPRTLLSLVDH